MHLRLLAHHERHTQGSPDTSNADGDLEPLQRHNSYWACRWTHRHLRAGPAGHATEPDTGRYRHGYEIPADDWNTIVATSNIPRDIVVDIAPAFAASLTTRARFQYLADILARHNGPNLAIDSITAVADTVHRQVVTIAAIVNPRPTAVKVTRLDTIVTVGPPYATETAGTFYDAPGTHLSVGSDTVYFVRLTSPLVATQPTGARIICHFHYNTINCATAAC
jgi:hypothetical protein